MSAARPPRSEPVRTLDLSSPDQLPTRDPSMDVSATLAADGAIIATVSRQVETSSAGPGTCPEQLTVISVTGDLDHDSAPLLSIALTSAINAGRNVCCDLAQVSFLSAAGVNTVLAAHRLAAGQGRRLTLRGARGVTRRVLELTGIPEVLALES